MSPSTRRAWIEITIQLARLMSLSVALHPEGVDRNPPAALHDIEVRVALHPEGVDRNRWMDPCNRIDLRVALHPEGVDRNPRRFRVVGDLFKSPSTRRAWIEIVVYFSSHLKT